MENMKELARSAAQSRKAIAAFSAALGAAVSALVTFRVTVAKLEESYAARADSEIAEARDHYRLLYKNEGYQTPGEAVKTLLVPTAEDPLMTDAVRALTNYQGMSRDGRPGLKEVTRNVFTDQEPATELDLDEEMKKRDPEHPYVISEQEYLEGAAGHDQQSLTYYKGDNVLADDKDSEIKDVDGLVGVENLDRFGQGSGDPHIVYVRNARRSEDYEVVLSKGKYAEEVLGLEVDDDGDELTHSYQPMRRRRRLGEAFDD